MPMSRRARVLSGLVLAGATAVGLVLPGQAAVVAAPGDLSAAALARLAPHRPDPGHAWIQGVVTSPSGDALGTAVAEAFAASDPTGDPVATSLMYASPDDSVEQGFYRLWGLDPGRYLVKITSTSATYKSVWTAPVRVGDRDVATLDVVLPLAPRPTSTRASLDDASITTKQRGVVDVTVSSRATRKPTGTVEIRAGRKVLGSEELRRSDRGELPVVLDRLGAGRLGLKAYFLGSRSLEASSSKAMTLEVTKPRRHHHR